jgi:hypothetical protein
MKQDRPYLQVVLILLIALGLAVAFVATAQKPDRSDVNQEPTEGG